MNEFETQLIERLDDIRRALWETSDWLSHVAHPEFAVETTCRDCQKAYRRAPLCHAHQHAWDELLGKVTQ